MSLRPTVVAPVLKVRQTSSLGWCLRVAIAILMVALCAVDWTPYIARGTSTSWLIHLADINGPFGNGPLVDELGRRYFAGEIRGAEKFDMVRKLWRIEAQPERIVMLGDKLTFTVAASSPGVPFYSVGGDGMGTIEAEVLNATLDGVPLEIGAKPARLPIGSTSTVIGQDLTLPDQTSTGDRTVTVTVRLAYREQGRCEPMQVWTQACAYPVHFQSR